MYLLAMGITPFTYRRFEGDFLSLFWWDFEKSEKYFEGFSSGASRMAGFGEGTPQQDLPQGQNRRYADFGTVVESCSKKLPLSSVSDFAAIHKGQLGWFPSI